MPFDVGYLPLNCHLSLFVCDTFQVTEELERIKMDMEERGSSMTDGGKYRNHGNSFLS